MTQGPRDQSSPHENEKRKMASPSGLKSGRESNHIVVNIDTQVVSGLRAAQKIRNNAFPNFELFVWSSKTIKHNIMTK